MSGSGNCKDWASADVNEVWEKRSRSCVVAAVESSNSPGRASTCCSEYDMSCMPVD
jgi:hypothetical protein